MLCLLLLLLEEALVLKWPAMTILSDFNGEIIDEV